MSSFSAEPVAPASLISGPLRRPWLRLALIVGGFVLAPLAIYYGPKLATLYLLPPESGYFRENRQSDAIEPHARRYLTVEGHDLVSWRLLFGYFSARWEIVPHTGHEYFLYDECDEFAGVATFTRRELTIRFQGGEERRYPREFDLWPIWYARLQHVGRKTRYQDLAGARRRHAQFVADHMRAAGASVDPAADARRRPPLVTTAVRLPEKPAVPLLTVTETDRETSGCTIFALYADMPAIALAPVDPEDQAPGLGGLYRTLDRTEARRALQRFLDEPIPGFRGRYTIVEGSDQATCIWVSGRMVAIYGPWQEQRVPPSADAEYRDFIQRRNEAIAEGRKRLPPEILTLLQIVEELRARPGPRWLPARLEVDFGQYEYAKEPALAWPQDWPGLYAPTSRKLPGNGYAVYLPASAYDRLVAFLRQRTARGAVLVDFNLMRPYLRLNLPAEELWLRAIRDGVAE